MRLGWPGGWGGNKYLLICFALMIETETETEVEVVRVGWYVSEWMDSE